MEQITKTGYEWCVDANLRLLKISQWDTQMCSYEESYYKERIDVQEFYRRLELCQVKPNSQPRKTEMYLEYRMYGLVPYNISPIQQGIQYGHAVVDYAQAIKGIPPYEKLYNKWANEDKTFIILNGGTTNTNLERLGSLNKHLATLSENGVVCQDFYEPDLGDQLTAVVFLADERVFNKELYPKFVPEQLPLTYTSNYKLKKPTEKQLSELEERNLKNYLLWEEKLGGSKNTFLRTFLEPFRLA
jgi:hypothetical protein